MQARVTRVNGGLSLAPPNCFRGASYSAESAIDRRGTARGRLARNGATCYHVAGINRPSQSVPKRMAGVTRRSETTTRDGRDNSRTNLLIASQSRKDEALMNKSFHLLGTVTAAAALLSACSKDAHTETSTAAPATARFEANQEPPPEATRNAGLDTRQHSPGSGPVRAMRTDMYLPCEGKKAGDECMINLGGREIRTQCVSMLDESNETRLSCGSQRPPASLSGGPPRTTPIDSYSPCDGKPPGAECVLKVGTQEVKSYCYAMRDGGSDARMSCGPPAPHR
jgi:hypothetical protein